MTTATEPFYRSRIAIDRVALHNVPVGFRLIPGMPVTADIKVGKRTVLQYLLGLMLPVAKEAYARTIKWIVRVRRSSEISDYRMVVDRFIGLASPAAALRRAIQLIEQQQFAAAFPLLSRAAKAGIPDAEFHLARAYLEGAGVPPSQTEGLRWLRRAASHGSAEAQVAPGRPLCTRFCWCGSGFCLGGEA